MNVQNITITKNTAKGSPATRWNVDFNDVPFGQIWTYKVAGEIHPFHAKTLAGAYAAFDNYNDAETFIRGEM